MRLQRLSPQHSLGPAAATGRPQRTAGAERRNLVQPRLEHR